MTRRELSAPQRLSAFAAVLVAVLAASYGVGTATADLSAEPTAPPTHDGTTHEEPR